MSDASIARTAFENGSGVRIDGTYYVLLGGPQGVTRNPIRPATTVPTTYRTLDFQNAGIIGYEFTFTVACTSWSQVQILETTADKVDKITFTTPWGDDFSDSVLSAITEGKMRSDLCSSDRWNHTLTITSKKG